jgi:hypothetical protein
MGRFLLPLFLIGLGGIGLVEHGTINALWAAVYPDDPTRETALSRCAQDDGMLTRFSASGRAACYQKYLSTEVAPATPGVNVGISGAQPAAPPGTPPGPPAHAVPHAPALHTNSNQR